MTTDSKAIARATPAGKRAFAADWAPDRISTAPGRLEVLGNHVDYSGGKVIAAAIDRSVTVASRTTGSQGQIAFAFGDFGDSTAQVLQAQDFAEWRNDSSPPKPEDYVRGAVA